MKYNNGKTSWEHGEAASNYHNEWHKKLGPCPECGSPTFDYGGGWRCFGSDCFNSPSNPISNLGPAPSWWNSGINVIKDGNAWVAHGPEFVNLQESHVGFGNTPREAVKEYLNTAKPRR
jgi:hypothetical protein